MNGESRLTGRVVSDGEAVQLDRLYDVLDKGSVSLTDYMGDDMAVVQAARACYGPGTKTLREDQALIGYLLENRHTTPFEMVQVKFHVKAPIFVARQWFRHRTASYNEMSGRYSEMPDEFYVPKKQDVTLQDQKNRQGGTLEMMVGAELESLGFREEQGEQHKDYRDRLDAGMRKELARINLGTSLYTQFYFSQNLWNLMHMLGLRDDSHAQLEIRVYAQAIRTIVEDMFPICMAAWREHMRDAVTFSYSESIELGGMLQDAPLYAGHLGPKAARKLFLKVGKLRERHQRFLFEARKADADGGR